MKLETGNIELRPVLSEIRNLIIEYHSGAYQSHSTLMKSQRDLAVFMYFLGEFKVQYHQEYVKLYSSLKEDKRSHASIERECQEMVPELYLCRQLLDRCTTVSIAMQNDLKHIEKS